MPVGPRRRGEFPLEPIKMEAWIAETEGIDHLTRETLEALQKNKLNRMLSTLRNKGGRFSTLPCEIEDLDELRSLPFTTPDMLREAPNRFLACSQSLVSRIISEATSGTTGGAKRVFYTEKDLDRTVGFFASGIHEMLSPGEKCMIAFPFSGPSGLGDLIARAVEKLGGIPIPAGFGGSYDDIGAILRREKPETYIGFPVPLLGMLRFFRGDLPIRRALISGDGCPAAVEAALGQAITLYPHYGSRETALGGAVTCSAFQGMHLRENDILAEIVDEAGRPLPDGSWGELVITTIGMEAMPLLRYRTGDMTRFLREPCPCGGITKRLDRVIRHEEGQVTIDRLDDILLRLPSVIDFRATMGDTLCIEALTRGGRYEIENVLGRAYPDLPIEVRTEQPQGTHGPMYRGKRRVIRVESEKQT